MAGTIFSRNCWQTDTSRISHCGVCSCAHRRVGPGCWVSMWGYTRKLSANFIRIHRHVRWMRLWAHHFRLHARSIPSSDHKGDLQLSLLAQFPLVCGKNLGIPFKRRDLCQSGNVHDGKTVPFCHAGISQMLLVDRSKWMKHWKVLFLSIRIIAVLTGRWLGCSLTCYLLPLKLVIKVSAIAPIAPRTGAESRMDYALLDNNYVSMSFCSLCRGW